MKEVRSIPRVMHDEHSIQAETLTRPGLPQRAFTLVELLIAVAIIAMLIALALPTLAGSREQGRRARCGVQMRSAVEQLIEWDRYPDPLPPEVDLRRCPSHRDRPMGLSTAIRGRASYDYLAWPWEFTGEFQTRVFHDLGAWHDGGRNVGYGDASVSWERGAGGD